MLWSVSVLAVKFTAFDASVMLVQQSHGRQCVGPAHWAQQAWAPPCNADHLSASLDDACISLDGMLIKVV